MTNAVTRFHRDGPPGVGLERWEEMDASELLSGEPVQNGHTYHEIEAEGYIAGVWDCTAFVDHMGKYSVDEFMYLLEGTLIMRMPDGEEIHLKAGDAFVIPKGLECQWDQPGYIRKFFMILDGPVPEAGCNPALTRITVPDLSGGGSMAGAVVRERVDFMNAAGNMQVRHSTHTATAIPAMQIAEHQLIQVLEGALTLTSDAGEETYNAGDTAYLMQGSSPGWATKDGTRLLTSSYRSPA
ncbi:MAG: cupin domain-containing protein [Pseudomonadota bacterium]